MKNASKNTPALEQAHHRATLVGRLLERHGITLSRAQQLEAVAYLEGASSWHVLAAELKAHVVPGKPVGAYTAGELASWRVEVVPLDYDGEALVIDESRVDSISHEAKLQVVKYLGRINSCFDPESTLAVSIDGQLGIVVEQEFMSTEADGDDYAESEVACIERLRQNLFPRIEPLLKSIPGARLAVVTDSDLVWNGRPTCWVYMPITGVTEAHCDALRRELLDFAYPEGSRIG